jgi:hypothetical protein
MEKKRNLWVIPTDKPSRLQLNVNTKTLILFNNIQSNNESAHLITQNIYITSDEEIKEGDPRINNYQRKLKGEEIPSKKIILTTDQDLIKDGVQAIDDEFLEWFVKNPSCEEVEVFHQDVYSMSKWDRRYKIIIPKEEPKTAWVGVLHDKLNEYHPAEYELKDIYQGEGCLPHFPDEELCQIWCESKYKEVPQQDKIMERFIKNAKQQETIEDKFKSLVSKWQQQQVHYEILAEHYIDDQHNNRKFTYKAMATRDCWKELLTLINSIADEK